MQLQTSLLRFQVTCLLLGPAYLRCCDRCTFVAISEKASNVLNVDPHDTLSNPHPKVPTWGGYHTVSQTFRMV
jgi:hypothetical protein